MKIFPFLCVIIIASCCFSCKQKSKENKTQAANETNEQLIKRTKASFKTVFDIPFAEVYRRFDNGVSFNNNGYQLKPSWKIKLLSDSSASVFSPVTKRFYTLPLTLDHDSIFALAGAFFKVRKLSKDSLKFQVLSVKNKNINWKNSNVYVTFYADEYLKKLPESLESLRKPTAKDTAFVRNLIAQDSRDSTKTFAAQDPVTFKSKNPNVAVTNPKLKAKILNSYYIPETLFYPEYHVVIHHAYAKFYHSFAVRVDADGQMHFIEPMETMLDDQRENTVKVMKGIMNGYLKVYLQTKPGTTLGIPHDSNILLTVEGYPD